MDRKPEYEFENDRLLDRLLKEDPGYFLSDDFADHLVKKIEIQQSFKQNTIEFLTIMGAVIGIVVTFGATYYFLNKADFLVLKSMLFNEYTLVVALIALFIYFMDKVFLRLLNQLK